MNGPSQFSRVLVARLDSLGDVLLAGPAVRAVAASAKVTMLVREGLDEAAEMLPGVDDVMEFDAPWVLFDPPPVRPHTIAHLVSEVEARVVVRGAWLGSRPAAAVFRSTRPRRQIAISISARRRIQTKHLSASNPGTCSGST